MSTNTEHATNPAEQLPRWSVADVHESLDARSFVDAIDRLGAESTRLVALFDEHDIRAVESRPVTDDDGRHADAAIRAFNAVTTLIQELGATVYATVSTDSRDEQAQRLLSRLQSDEARITPLLARLADWVHALGVDELARVSSEVAEHRGPLLRLDERSAHQMGEAEEGLYAELSTTGSGAWSRLQRDVTSQLSAEVVMPDGSASRLPMPAVRGLATSPDAEVRKAAYDTELTSWPTVATPDVRSALRPRSVRPVPRRPRAVPGRIHRPALASGHGHRRATRRAVRPRRDRSRVLDCVARRLPRPDRAVRAPGSRAHLTPT